MKVVLLPGFNGAAEQPILVRLSARLEARGASCLRLAPPRLKLDAALSLYVAWLQEALRPLTGPLVLVGRSFGGRVALRVAESPRVRALVLLGFPLRPPGRSRPLDEQALLAVRCPTLVVQGTRDPLGPLEAFAPALAANPLLEVQRVEGAAHAFGRQEAAALDAVAGWLGDTVGLPGAR